MSNVGKTFKTNIILLLNKAIMHEKINLIA